MAEVFDFIPRGGEAAREQREKEKLKREVAEVEALAKAAGLELESPAFDFKNLYEQPAAQVVSMWNELIEEYSLDQIPTRTMHPLEDVQDEATPEQLRRTIIDDYLKITKLDTMEARQEYWQQNPRIKSALAIAVGSEVLIP